jgi:hypothetical protein
LIINIQLLYESFLYRFAVGRFQCIYDIRLVRTSEVAGNESNIQLATLCGYPVFLDDSPCRE